MNLKRFNLFKKIVDFVASPKERKVLHINRPTFDLEEKRELFTQFINLEELTIIVDAHYQYELPKEIGQLHKLKKLHVLNFPFTEFPEWIFNLTNLEDLTIRGNSINFIPSGFNQLLKLRDLKIENTDLKSFPTDIQNLKNLKSLSLIDNSNLNEIKPEYLPSNLRTIALNGSSISSQEREEIRRLRPNLRIV